MNKNNEYLKDVLDDYKKYHGHIAEQKSQFSGQLNKLVKHLEKQMKDAGLTEQEMRQAKFERNRILSQLDKMVEEGFLKQANRDMLFISNSVNDLMKKMNNYKTPKTEHVINKVVS
mgnify:CR=1 FL=1